MKTYKMQKGIVFRFFTHKIFEGKTFAVGSIIAKTANAFPLKSFAIYSNVLSKEPKKPRVCIFGLLFTNSSCLLVARRLNIQVTQESNH